MQDRNKVIDEIVVTMDRKRPTDDGLIIWGEVEAVLTGPDGEIKGYCRTENLVTNTGDNIYAGRGSGASGAAAAPTGMKLGTGGTAVAKTGAGAALVTYLAGSNKAFDATFPSVAANVATYKRTYAAGEATTASAITECVVVNDTIGTDATSVAGATMSRALLTGIGSKGASDTLTITWTHTILGA